MSATTAVSATVTKEESVRSAVGLLVDLSSSVLFRMSGLMSGDEVAVDGEFEASVLISLCPSLSLLCVTLSLSSSPFSSLIRPTMGGYDICVGSMCAADVTKVSSFAEALSPLSSSLCAFSSSGVNRLPVHKLQSGTT